MAERARDLRKYHGRDYPHGRSVPPPGVREVARPQTPRASQDPQLLLRRAVVEVGVAGVVLEGLRVLGHGHVRQAALLAQRPHTMSWH